MDVQSGDYGRVQYSVDGGTNWANLGFSGDPLGTNWYNTQSGGVHYFSQYNTGWQYSAYKLVPTTFNIHNDVRFRFDFQSNTSGNSNGWAVDDFKLALPVVPNDVGISKINYPVADTAMGSSITPTVTISNYGTNSQTMVPLEVKIGGTTVISEVWSGALAGQSTTTYTFIQSFTVPADPYQLCITTKLPGDQHPSNDATCKYFNPLPAYHDVGVTRIVAPIPDSIGEICFYDPSLQPWYKKDVIIKLKNFGLNAQTSIPVKYTFFNGGPTITDTWTGNLASGDSIDFLLSNQFLPKIGVQQVCAETNLLGDFVPSNNKACQTYIGRSCIGIDDKVVDGFVVRQNIPNPTNGHTLIPYVIPESGKIALTITDITGRILHHEQTSKPAGEHQFEFNVSNLPAGVYCYTLEFSHRRITRQMIVQ